MEMNELRKKNGFICDMDGVLYHGNRLLEGAGEFIHWLIENKKKFLFLTNSSERSPIELRQKLQRLGIDVEQSHFYTSALATADFLSKQKPGAECYVIGEAGLIHALYEVGLSMNDVNPDYVIVGDTRGYSYEKIEKAAVLVRKGARLIGTNPDITGPTEAGIVPATGSLIAPIELTAGVKAYFLGKPNPLIMRHALKRLKCNREETVIIGDRMDTDIIAGVESEIDTVLVLSGVASRDDLSRFPYKPDIVLSGVGDIAHSPR